LNELAIGSTSNITAFTNQRNQMLLPHRDLEEMTIYLHVTGRHLSATGTPLDALTLAAQEIRTASLSPAAL
jgi:hypothetical protein